MTTPVRDHLFLSYATEDSALLEWLALKLTAEGYRVWCDRLKLLGGEPYPTDIDRAIKERSFRVLALLSRNSLAKQNPMKERTCALAVGRARQEPDFLIPLNVDGLRPDELDWMTTDLTFIPFSPSWATGLAALLRKLESINAPRDQAGGQALLKGMLASLHAPLAREEKVWTNLLPLRVPRGLKRIELRADDAAEWPGPQTVAVRHGSVIWTFEEPPPNYRLQTHEEIDWETIAKRERGDDILNTVRDLVTQALEGSCMARGMRLNHDRSLWFPKGLLTDDKIQFRNYRGRRTYVNVVGVRRFRSRGAVEETIHHLAVHLSPRLFQFGGHFVRLQPRVHLTDSKGRPFDDGKTIVRRRKKICKNWFNHKWFSRVLAILEWLGAGNSQLAFPSARASFDVALTPLALTLPYGIAEDDVDAAVATEAVDEQAAPDSILDDSDESDDDDEGGADES